MDNGRNEVDPLEMHLTYGPPAIELLWEPLNRLAAEVREGRIRQPYTRRPERVNRTGDFDMDSVAGNPWWANGTQGRQWLTHNWEEFQDDSDHGWTLIANILDLFERKKH
jgi:hypothetical protein